MDALAFGIAHFFARHNGSAKKYMLGTILVQLLAALISILLPALFGWYILLIDLVAEGMGIFFFLGFVPTFDLTDHNRRACRWILEADITVFILSVIVLPLWKLQYTLKIHALIAVCIGAVIMMLILTRALLTSEKAKKVITSMETGVFKALNVTKEVTPGDIVLCSIKEELENDSKDPREILPAKDRFLHMLILGPTGSGKTSQTLIPMVLQDVQNPNWGITVLEPKGDFAVKAHMMAKRYDRKSMYFDPSYDDCPKFNPLAGPEIEAVENVAMTFRMLNPDSPQFFLNLNEQLTRNAVKVLKRLDKAHGLDGEFANLITLSELLQNSGGKGRELVNYLSQHQAPETKDEEKETFDICTWFLNEYFIERSKLYENTSEVRSQVSRLISNTYLRKALNPDVKAGEKNELNFDKHFAEGGVLCISTAQGALGTLSNYLGYFIILAIQSSVFRRPGNENTRSPHTLYIDEFQTYSTPGFANMLTQGRSYRVSSVLATQGRDQIAMGGGKAGEHFLNLVLANARNVVLFPGINKDDAKYFSERFGEYEKTEVQVGHTHKTFNLLTGGLDKLGHPTESVREQKKMTPNFSVTDLIYGQNVGASFGEITYSIMKNNSVQPARVGIVSYIPRELNEELDAEILDYSEAHQMKSPSACVDADSTEPVFEHQDHGLSFNDSLLSAAVLKGPARDLEAANEPFLAPPAARQDVPADMVCDLTKQKPPTPASIDLGDLLG